ncbi:MAG: transcriptional regulator [Myxococcaceae bacterium]
MKPKSPAPIPAERSATIRAALREELLRGFATAKELSERLSIPEKDLPGHLDHLQRSSKARGEKLLMQPSSCLECGFEFRTRRRFSTPGRCPECGSERVEPPAFRLEAPEPRSPG